MSGRPRATLDGRTVAIATAAFRAYLLSTSLDVTWSGKPLADPQMRPLTLAAVRDGRPVTSVESRCISFADTKPGSGDDDYARCEPSTSGTIGEVSGRTTGTSFYCFALNNPAYGYGGGGQVPDTRSRSLCP